MLRLPAGPLSGSTSYSRLQYGKARSGPPHLSFFVIDEHWMAVARGDEPADLVLSGGHVLSVFTKEWLDRGVAGKDGHVVGPGRDHRRETPDASGADGRSGLIDAHIHLEPAQLMVDHCARAVLAHG